jgi:REP element-mobilizing transposase RayT
LADAARHTGVLIHRVCVMSNHWHSVVTDPEARLPEFLERFHRLLARALNASLGRCENFWSSDKPSIVRLVSDADILDKMAYVAANPTAAGLVRAPEEWPGVISHRLEEATTVQRPDFFFDPDGRMPAELTLKVVRPPIYSHLSTATLERHLRQAIARKLRQAHESLRRDARRFVGAKAIRHQPIDATPRSAEIRRNPSPRIAARHAPERLLAVQNLLDFVRRYRAAWHAWRNGARLTTFPAGTYALRIYARVACEPATC